MDTGDQSLRSNLQPDKGVRFGVLTVDEAGANLEQISLLGVQLFLPDGDQNRLAFEWTLKLKRSAAHDSYYVALAETLGCELWTADRWLFNAAQAAQSSWVHWVNEINIPQRVNLQTSEIKVRSDHWHNEFGRRSKN